MVLRVLSTSCIMHRYLEQLEGGQQVPRSAVPAVQLVILQLRGEPGGAVVLVTHLGDGLGERPTYELGFSLNMVVVR